MRQVLRTLLAGDALGGSSFTPFDLFAGGYAGLSDDYRRTDRMFQLSNGTTAVASDDDPVGWNKSLDPTERIHTQATAASRPLWKTGGFLRCDGTADNLLTTLNPGASGNSMAAKVSVAASIAGDIYIMGTRDAGNTRWFMGVNSAGNLIGSVGVHTSSTIKDATDHRSTTGVAAIVENGATVKMYWNGIEVYSAAQSGVPVTNVPFRIGCANSNGTAAAFWTSDIYRTFAINRVITPAEVVQLTNYWG